MPLPQPRQGNRLRIKDRPLEFSFWPMERTSRRYGLGTRVFATDPWTVIRRSVERRCPSTERDAAFALIEQAEDFYTAAHSGVKAARPLLLYYCFMNLAKGFVLTARQRQDVNNAMHGLSEKLDPPPNNQELTNAWLDSYQTVAAGPVPPSGQKINMFDELLLALSAPGLGANNVRLDLKQLMPQIVPGHRLWVEGMSASEKERFIAIERIELWQNAQGKQIWLQLYLLADDLKRINISHQEFLGRARLANTFHEVACNESKDDRKLMCFEQRNTTGYGHRPSDSVPGLVQSVRHLLWRTVLAVPPYRKYYAYPAPLGEHPQILPQIASIYAVTFYLGSIVRYRPHHFDRILAGKFGAFIEAFLNDQATQFIYLMASEFAEKEVTKAAIV